MLSWSCPSDHDNFVTKSNKSSAKVTAQEAGATNEYDFHDENQLTFSRLQLWRRPRLMLGTRYPVTRRDELA